MPIARSRAAHAARSLPRLVPLVLIGLATFTRPASAQSVESDLPEGFKAPVLDAAD